jgi:glycosyltransferase involved in cell wall biosynthesis
MNQIKDGQRPTIETDHSVSIIVPCFNEESTIGGLLESIYQQTYPLQKMEVIIADGMSEDGTRAKIQEFQQTHQQFHVQIVDNPRRIIPAALNLAIRAASGEIILRLDAHCRPMPDYVARSVEGLVQGKGKNVGGLWKIQPGAETGIARSIAISASHPLAVGDARYRYSNKEGSVDTVPFGAFWKDYLVELGGYNEELLTNEDYELNTRIRQHGDTVWFDPDIQSIYYSRPNLKGLAKQYWRYGYWKCKMLKKYPGSLKLRQAIPPLFVMGWLLLCVAAIFSYLFQLILALMVLLYILALVVISLPAIFKEKDLALIIGLPLSIATMHFCWGAGYLWSLLK